jgi:hypothetical protein
VIGLFGFFGAILLALAAILAALAMGTRQGWVTPFDSVQQEREIWSYAGILAGVGVALVVFEVLR